VNERNGDIALNGKQPLADPVAHRCTAAIELGCGERLLQHLAEQADGLVDGLIPLLRGEVKDVAALLLRESDALNPLNALIAGGAAEARRIALTGDAGDDLRQLAELLVPDSDVVRHDGLHRLRPLVLELAAKELGVVPDLARGADGLRGDPALADGEPPGQDGEEGGDQQRDEQPGEGDHPRGRDGGRGVHAVRHGASRAVS